MNNPNNIPDGPINPPECYESGDDPPEECMEQARAEWLEDFGEILPRHEDAIWFRARELAILERAE